MNIVRVIVKMPGAVLSYKLVQVFDPPTVDQALKHGLHSLPIILTANYPVTIEMALEPEGGTHE